MARDRTVHHTVQMEVEFFKWVDNLGDIKNEMAFIVSEILNGPYEGIRILRSTFVEFFILCGGFGCTASPGKSYNATCTKNF